MPAPAETLRLLYEGFAARDGEAMAACYAPDATFEDPVFRLTGSDVGDMWRMLTERGKDLRVAYTVVDDANVEWTADYTFEGSPVHNEIRSEFELDDDGRIAKQVDTFSFPRWAAQALGLKGKLFGRFRFLQTAVRKASAARLTAWQRRRG
ncbi:MAG TPA: nuclear transport factor 2 family protein [Actinomycetota bacterium]